MKNIQMDCDILSLIVKCREKRRKTALENPSIRFIAMVEISHYELAIWSSIEMMVLFQPELSQSRAHSLLTHFPAKTII